MTQGQGSRFSGSVGIQVSGLRAEGPDSPVEVSECVTMAKISDSTTRKSALTFRVQ